MLEVNLTFVIVFILVWILVVVLGRVFFKPYLDIREKRRKILEENENTYKHAMREYESHLEKIETSLKEARLEAQLMREKVIAEALQEKARLVSEIQTEVKGQVAAARDELNVQTEKLKTELDQKVEELARQLEEKILH
ncbi:MAG: ATP synthase F0 subunit B [Candidatus Saccharicenans sp.]|uniref:ATP synthase F0 subunit B n=1 Tax=Candidatus Saccharicenans sp. TaxID=2819258 RepID=UPI00404988D5